MTHNSPDSEIRPPRGRRRRIARLVAAGLLLALAATYAVLVSQGVQPLDLLTARLSSAATRRPPEWAQPLAAPGLGNFHKVGDGLYRGAQPTAEGMRELEELGVRTVINLREFHSDRDKLAGTRLGYVHIGSTALSVDDDEVIEFLRVVTDRSRTPVFVHCEYGSDRTGTMCAVYRIAVQGWTKEQAIREMTEGGFGFHEGFENLVRYLQGLDAKRIRRAAGLSPQAGQATSAASP